LNKIKETRMRIKMSQKDLAKAMGVSQPTVSDWESGRKVPSGKNAVKLSQIFGESLDYLIYGTDVEPVVHDEDIKYALFGVRTVDDDLLEEVKRFAEYIKKKRDEQAK